MGEPKNLYSLVKLVRLKYITKIDTTKRMIKIKRKNQNMMPAEVVLIAIRPAIPVASNNFKGRVFITDPSGFY